MTTQTTLLSYTVVFSLVFTVLNLVYLIRGGRLFKICAKRLALNRGGRLLERGRLFEEIRYIYIYVCVCLCVCVSVYVYVYVCAIV